MVSGVRFDSRGMFTDIRNSLPKTWGSVLFDFYEAQENNVHITSVAEQVTRLKNVVHRIRNQYNTTTIHLVAHSKGCIVTALAKPDISGEVVLLSPPENFGTKLEKYFARYPGAKRTETELIIPRKDGTITHIPLSFFEETSRINAELAMFDYSKQHPIKILQTTQDEVLGKTEYRDLQNDENIEITQMPSDHNFTNQYRKELIKYLSEILNI
jgi:hypothetical protein